ncbi:MAG: DUF2207 domain-containing protein [Patescibacteria group bacterium]|nr:DUF2207 domain-containing protein [Patescibacteria group bacterium]
MPKEILAKDYSIKNTNIEIKLLPDGSARFSETRTYHFNGSFSRAEQWIPLTPRCQNCVIYKIKDISFRNESQIYSLDRSNNPNTFYDKIGENFHIKWRYSAHNTAKTFTPNYTIENAITNHLDISEFYWQAIGNKWGEEA